MKLFIKCLVAISSISLVIAAAPTNETNDQILGPVESTVYKPKDENLQANVILKIYRLVSSPIVKILNVPKVYEVVRNIGICLVNGAMELISYFLPAPMMPLIASAAGLMIPFEPVVTLKQKMPVTSYRRAFDGALKTFMGMFDKYKPQDDYYDPYMTQQFNRRFMNNRDRD